MLWNSDLPWEQKEYQWVRMISSTESNVGNQQLWILPQLQDLCLALGACTHVYCLVFTDC